MEENLEKRAVALDRQLESASLAGRLKLIADRYPRAIFTTSLGLEDQVITHSIAEANIPIRIVTLQTGRLFAETLELIERTQLELGVPIEAFEPDSEAVDAYVAQYGRDGFYESIEARHACCNIRKIAPLKRALEGADGWIAGLRREQSAARGDVPFALWSHQYGLMKFNPLADWPAERLYEQIRTHDIPINPLHGRGYRSIGCEPCTRAIKPGEPERAGRWWWEHDQTRECGLHPAAAAADSGAITTSSATKSEPANV